MKQTELRRSTPMKRTMPKMPRADPVLLPGPKMRKCCVKICRSAFMPSAPFQTWCSPECGAVVAMARLQKQKAKSQRQERASDKAKLLSMNPLRHFLKKAEHACNAYIRERDAGNGCISCGRKDAEIWNAGHFISVGANGTLRYDEDNIHLQCARPCNLDKGGNLIEYRKALLLKIGEERLARLESWHAPVKRTRADVEAIEAHYKAKLKQLKDSHV